MKALNYGEAWGMNERQKSLKTFYSEQKASDDIWQKDMSKKAFYKKQYFYRRLCFSAQLIPKDWFMYQSVPVWLNRQHSLGSNHDTGHHRTFTQLQQSSKTSVE